MTKTLKIAAVALLTLGTFSLAATAGTGKHGGDHRSGDAKTEVSTGDQGKRHELQLRHMMMEQHGDKTGMSGSGDGAGDASGSESGSDAGSDHADHADHSAGHGESGSGSSHSGSDN